MERNLLNQQLLSPTGNGNERLISLQVLSFRGLASFFLPLEEYTECGCRIFRFEGSLVRLPDDNIDFWVKDVRQNGRRQREIQQPCVTSKHHSAGDFESF